MNRIAENVFRIRERIAEAALQSGRAADAVRLVAVTKYVGLAEIEALLEAGCRELGESRPQSLWERAGLLAGRDIAWHLVGHLQRNKVPRTLETAVLIQSVDSARLLAAINQSAASRQIVAHVLLEVNISRDSTKTGFAPVELEQVVPTLGDYPHVRVQGLMAMASLEGGLTEAERNFNDVRLLRDRLRAMAPAGVSLEELSMGMSGDYEAAIHAGATIVRIGSALFE